MSFNFIFAHTWRGFRFGHAGFCFGRLGKDSLDLFVVIVLREPTVALESIHHVVLQVGYFHLFITIKDKSLVYRSIYVMRENLLDPSARPDRSPSCHDRSLSCAIFRSSPS